MHFQQDTAAVVDGGAHAQAGHGRQRQRSQAVHLHDEDAGQGRAVCHAQVQGGEAQRAAQLLAVDHMAGNGVGVAQQLRRQREIAGRQRQAHGRRGNARAAIHDGGQGFHVETVLAARFLQHGHVAGAPGAVAEVVADHQPLHVQAVDEDLFREFLRRQGGELGAEMLDDDAIDAGVVQRLQLVAQVGDALRGFRQVARALREEFARMRFERHDGRLDAEFGCCFAHARQQGLMADVDTVKIADGQGAGRSCLGIGKSAEYLHRNLMKNCAKWGIIRTVSGMHSRKGGQSGNFRPETDKKRCQHGAGSAFGRTRHATRFGVEPSPGAAAWVRGLITSASGTSSGPGQPRHPCL